MEGYRNLTEAEIFELTNKNSCIADDWSDVWVKDGFNVKRVFQTRFSGTVKLGVFEKEFELPGGIKKKSGVRYATLHNVTIGDNSCVENVHNYIANYEIGSETYIKNVGMILVDGVSSFGDGVKVSVLNETGGREVSIYSKLSAQQAYITALYRHRPKFIEKMNSLADSYVEKHSSAVGRIGNKVTVINSGTIRNVNISSFTKIDGASRLSNGSLNSEENASVIIGNNVTCDNFIICAGSKVLDGVTLNRCFVGQSCYMSNNYSASDSLFFCNSHGENGEACAIFAGPYTVTHHKSTLLIAGMFSFMNAGSGSNQSNHMYKLGPIHHGILDRGAKTTSDSYILFPSHVGPFSLIMGRHVDHVDTSDFPFSYLIEEDNRTLLVPGVNLRSVGTIRDAKKWPERDGRKGRVENKLDFINYNILSPYTVQKMMNGYRILKDLMSMSGVNCQFYAYQNAKIKNSSLVHGLKLYDMAIRKFLGNSIISRLGETQYDSEEDLREALRPTYEAGTGPWVDMSGLIAPKGEVQKLISKIEDGTICNLPEINAAFREMYDNYYEYEWTWVYSKIEEYYGIRPEDITASELIKIVEGWKDAVVTLDNMIYEDSKKEFSLLFKTGFGIDGDTEQKDADFYFTRGDFATSSFPKMVQEHILVKSELGERTIAMLRKVAGAM